MHHTPTHFLWEKSEIENRLYKNELIFKPVSPSIELIKAK